MSLSQNYPTISPSLLLDFANSGRLDPQVTFTRSSTATYFDASGTLRTANNNVPRFDYNPATLAAQGLLIEESRTNLLTYSEAFDTAPDWTVVRASVSPDVTVAPDGTSTADKLVEDATPAATHQIQKTISYTAGVTYTRSVFAKAAERSIFRFQLPSGAFGTGQNAYFDLSTGTVISVSAPATASCTPVGNGWYRCSITSTATITASAIEISFGLCIAGPNPIYNGDGTSGLYLWGAQLEAGAFPTSYIPTTTTALTRAADVASVNTLSPWFNADEGTLFAEAQKIYSGSSAFPRLVQISDASNNNSITALWADSLNRLYGAVTAAGATQADIGNNGLTQTAIHKTAFSYKINDFAISNDGASVVTDTSGTVPTVNRMFIGKDAGTTFLNGYLRRITYYPRKLSSAELQAITA